MPFPEEHHRRLIAQLATVHFAPTSRARDALLAEGIAASAIHVTGNPVIDALDTTRRRFNGHTGAEATARWDARPLIVVTAHRRESHGPRLAAVADAVARLAATGRCEIVAMFKAWRAS